MAKFDTIIQNVIGRKGGGHARGVLSETYGGWWLEGHPKYNGLAIGDTSLNAATVICSCAQVQLPVLALLYHEGIIVLTSSHCSSCNMF